MMETKGAYADIDTEGQETKVKTARSIFHLLNIISVTLGAGIMIFSAMSISRYPQLTAILGRILSAGGALLTSGLFGVCCSSLCVCCCACCSANCLLKSLLATLSVGFELILYAGLFLFFHPYWRAVDFVNGNVSKSNGTDYDSGGNINDILKEHFKFSYVAPALCFVGFFVLVVSSVCVAFLLRPINFAKQLPKAVIALTATVASECVFIGGWFLAIETFSSSMNVYLSSYVIIGGIVGTILLFFGVLKCCKCGCFGRIGMFVSTVVLGMLVVACFIIFVVVGSSRSKEDRLTRQTITNDCSTVPVPEPVPNIPSGLLPSYSSLVDRLLLVDEARRMHETKNRLELAERGEGGGEGEGGEEGAAKESPITNPHRRPNQHPQPHTAQQAASDLDPLPNTHPNDSNLGADPPPPPNTPPLSSAAAAAAPPSYCMRVQSNLQHSYGCGKDAITGNAQYCNNPEEVAIATMAYISDGFVRMLVYSSGIMLIILLAALIFIILAQIFFKNKKKKKKEPSEPTSVLDSGGGGVSNNHKDGEEEEKEEERMMNARLSGRPRGDSEGGRGVEYGGGGGGGGSGYRSYHHK